MAKRGKEDKIKNQMGGIKTRRQVKMLEEGINVIKLE